MPSRERERERETRGRTRRRRRRTRRAARQRRLLPRDINSSNANSVRKAYERSIGSTVGAAAIAKRAWATPALWLVWLPADREFRGAKG